MNRFLAIGTGAFLVVFLSGAANAHGQTAVGIVDKGPEHHLIYEPGEIKWKDGPGSLEPGAQFAILEGNPGKPGVFTMRIRMPDGFRIAPHWHPNVERVTVVSGTLRLGSGKKFDREATKPLKAGSYFSMPPGMGHFVIAEGDTIVQLTTVGPWNINYIEPKDDPRKK